MKRKLHIVLFSISFFLAQALLGQERNLTISQLQDSIHVRPKPAMLLIHTDWCQYCAMQKKQLSDRNEQKAVYFAEFNGEQREKVLFKGRLYTFKPTGRNTGTHELVTQLATEKNVSYPLWVIFDKELNVLETYTGYLRPEEVDKIIETLSEHNYSRLKSN